MPQIPWKEIGDNPSHYFDQADFLFPVKLQAPDLTPLPDLYALVDCLSTFMKPFMFYSKETIARNLEVPHHEESHASFVSGEEQGSDVQEGGKPETMDVGGEERASVEQEGGEPETGSQGGKGASTSEEAGESSGATGLGAPPKLGTSQDATSSANETAEDPISDQPTQKTSGKGSKRKRASGGSQPKKQPNTRPKRGKATTSPADKSEPPKKRQ
jgi:hypothetical protein